MKYRAAFAMALAALILTACAAEPAAGITPAAESAALAVTTQEPPAAAVASGKPLVHPQQRRHSPRVCYNGHHRLSAYEIRRHTAGYQN